MFGRCAVAIATWLALLASGCDQLSQFRTSDDEAYLGEIIGSDSGDAKASFIRSGFASHSKMELTFDPSLASVIVDDHGGGMPPPAPGTLDTFVCPAGNRDCHAGQGVPSLFVGAKLERIENLSNDALSEYDFPGGGRLRNYMFYARTHASDAGAPARVATVFLSLMENERIEVRVIGPSVLDPQTQAELDPALFGVFVLERHKL